MSTVLLILANIVGSIIFLFFLWRRLREDYSGIGIFSLGFYIIAGIVVGLTISSFLSPRIHKLYFFDPQGLWFWGSLVGASSGLVISLNRFKIKFFEGLESAALGLVSWFFIFLASSGLIYKNIPILIFSIIVLVLILLFFFIDKRYKSFSWYQSGKVGFSGLTLLASFFLARAAIAILDPSMLSFTSGTGQTLFIGKIDSLVSAILSFIFFLGLYNLSGKYE